MLKNIELRNFGPLVNVTWANLGPINLVIGGNGEGKTFVLKALYSAVRALEHAGRGREPRSVADILSDKVYWTFQPGDLGALVRKGARDALVCKLTFEDGEFAYSFGKSTTRKIRKVEKTTSERSTDSVFLPPKEVLSIQHLILEAYQQKKAFGFDDTYVDLASALQRVPRRPETGGAFEASRRSLQDIVGGQVVYDFDAKTWRFKQGNQTFAIGVTSEGTKKIGMLEALLNAGHLTPGSIVFIDEPEEALHPKAISTYLDVIAELAEQGIQFFIASHSYFVVKKLYLLALERSLSIPVLSAVGGEWEQSDLKDGLSPNPIIDESIRLYEEEVEVAFR